MWSCVRNIFLDEAVRLQRWSEMKRPIRPMAGPYHAKTILTEEEVEEILIIDAVEADAGMDWRETPPLRDNFAIPLASYFWKEILNDDID